MKYLSLKPFVPSGSDFKKAAAFFQELGFTMTWDMGDYAGFENHNCSFI